ncbi:MAG TPA: hypothetical protein VN661_03240 [Candidatus Acidoferrales bacterium]|nr:hypothetical protein [Candidatus Acidoferrales bacterium]
MGAGKIWLAFGLWLPEGAERLRANSELSGDRFAVPQRDDEIEKLLVEIKSRQQASN